MLTVICGEDSATARKHYHKLILEYKKEGYNLITVEVNDIGSILKNSSGNVDLFGQTPIYLVADLSSKYKGRGKTKDKETISQIAQDKKIQVIDWEDGKSGYELASFKKVATVFTEFKPERSIFDLLDQCRPGNLHQFLKSLNMVSQSQDSLFIYTLLWRHTRKLILAKADKFEATTAPWQRGRLRSQASKWEEKALKNFYLGLIKIDFAQKSGDRVFDIKKSIEILACYFLK